MKSLHISFDLHYSDSAWQRAKEYEKCETDEELIEAIKKDLIDDLEDMSDEGVIADNPVIKVLFNSTIET